MALLLVLATLSVAQPRRADGASGSKRQKVPAHFVYHEEPAGGGCTWAIGVEFGLVSGASAYDVSYWDGYWKQPEHGVVTPAQARAARYAQGNGFAGVTGGGGSSPCAGGGDPTEGGRFSRGATVYALFPEKAIEVSGHVTQCIRDAFGCTGGHGVAGIQVTARLSGGGVTRAYTAFDGSYRMLVPKKGTYTFHAQPNETNHAVDRWSVRPGPLRITGRTMGVSFVGYNHKDGLPPPASLFDHAPPGTLAAVAEIKARDPSKPTTVYLQHNGKGPVTEIHAGAFLQKGDVITTDSNTLMALELALGGRVGINDGSEVELTGERSVKGNDEKGFTLSKGGLWAKCGQLKEPLEIQTNGGTMGIKG